jgi:transposase
MHSQHVAREAGRDKRLTEWASLCSVDLTALDAGQQWVIFAALSFLEFVGRLAPMRRVVAYLLSHCRMDLASTVIGAVVGTTDRAVRKTRQVPARELWKRLREARRGHPPPKLRKEQVGPVAKFLAEHKRCSVAELLGFILETFNVQMDRLTLRRFLKRYGLGCLREDEVEDTPLLPDVLLMEEHSP